MVTQTCEQFDTEKCDGVENFGSNVQNMDNICTGLENASSEKSLLNIESMQLTELNSSISEPRCSTEKSIFDRIKIQEDTIASSSVESEILEHKVEMLRTQITRLRHRNYNLRLKPPRDLIKKKCLKSYVKRLKMDNANLKKQIAALKGEQNMEAVNERELLKKNVTGLRAEIKVLHLKLNEYVLTLKSMHKELEDKKKYICLLNSKATKVNNKLDALWDEMDNQRNDFIAEELQLQSLKGRLTYFINQMKQKIQEVLRIKAKYRSKLIALSNEKKQMRMMRQKKVGKRPGRKLTGQVKMDE